MSFVHSSPLKVFVESPYRKGKVDTQIGPKPDQIEAQGYRSLEVHPDEDQAVFPSEVVARRAEDRVQHQSDHGPARVHGPPASKTESMSRRRF